MRQQGRDLMALHHTRPSTPVDVQPLRERLSGEASSALFKARDLEVLRLVLLAGKSMPPHEVAGDITLQCIEGALEIESDDGAATLEAGRLLYLRGGVRYRIRAVMDSSALMTIALKSELKSD